MLNILSIIIWPILNRLYSFIPFHKDHKTQNKLVVNTVSMTNCYSSFLLGSFYYLTNSKSFYDFAISLSFAYFIWDTYRIILLILDII